MIARVTFALSVALVAPAARAHAQIPVTAADINPNQSTLDATDPDGASGGRVNGIGVDVATAGTFYAASEWGGVHKSTDNGLTWRHLDGHTPTATWDVMVAPTNSNRVYATSFFDGRTASRAGINVSSDGGVTWTHPASATPPANFCAAEARRAEPAAFGIAIDPADANDVYIGTNCGLAVSTDAGSNWAFIDPTPADRADNVWDVVVHDGGIIDLCGDDGHQRSVDGGATWTTAATAPLTAGRCSIAVSPDEAYVLFAVAGTTIFESDDGGANWTAGAYANPSPQGRIPFVATNQRAGVTYDLWFGDVSLHRGTCTTPAMPAPGGAVRCNASAAWAGGFTRFVAGGHDDTADIAFNPAAATDACPVLFSSDGGVYRNTVGASPACHTPRWAQPNVTPHGLWNFGFNGVGRPGAGPEDLYMGNQDNGTFGTLTAGATAPAWNNQRCCDGFDMAAEATRVLTTVCCNAGVTRLRVSAPGLAGPGPLINTPPPGQLLGFQQLENIVNFGADDYAVVTSTGVFVTDNVGANPVVWTQLGAASTPGGACGIQVSFVGTTPTFLVKNNGCNGDTAGTLWRHQGAAAGGTWVQVNGPGGGFGVYSVDATDPQRIFASQLTGAGAPRMVITRNGGATWTPMPVLDSMMTGGGDFMARTTLGPTSFTGFNGYPQPSLVALDPDDPDILAAGGVDSGVFLSVNGGTRWERVTDPLTPGTSGRPHIPRPRYAHFDHDPAGDDVNLFLGTQGRGAWRLTFTKILVPEIQVPPLEPLRACVGASDHGTLKVCNTSKGDLIVGGIASSNPEFSVAAPSGGFPVSISHDFCFPFPVTFTPAGPGPRTANFVIASNDSNFPNLTVTAEGAGTQTDVRVTGSTAFGVASAWTRSEQTVSVCNTGECPLTVSSAALGAGCSDFALIANPFPATLPSSTCVDLGIEFTPVLGGPRSCSLTINTSDPDTPVITRSLTGRMAPFLTVHAGLAVPHGALNTVADLGSTLNVGLVNYWRPKWAWDLRLGRSIFKGAGAADDTKTWSALANVRHSFTPAATVRPFVNAGGGLYHFRPGGVEGGLNLGIGLGVPTGRRLSIEGTYNFNLVFTASPDLKFSQFQLGVKLSF